MNHEPFGTGLLLSLSLVYSSIAQSSRVGAAQSPFLLVLFVQVESLPSSCFTAVEHSLKKLIQNKIGK